VLEDCDQIRTDDFYKWHDYPCGGGIGYHYSSICEHSKCIEYLRFPNKNDVRLLLYLQSFVGRLVSLRIVASNIFVLFFIILCTLCCQFLWIAYFWLYLRYSLTFIYCTIIYNTLEHCLALKHIREQQIKLHLYRNFIIFYWIKDRENRMGKQNGESRDTCYIGHKAPSEDQQNAQHRQLIRWVARTSTQRIWRHQRDNQNPYIQEEHTTQWPKEKVQKDKQRSTNHTHKTKTNAYKTRYSRMIMSFCLF
jgi:hypothetical protein